MDDTLYDLSKTAEAGKSLGVLSAFPLILSLPDSSRPSQ